MSPTSDLRSRAGTCLPPAMGWQHPVTSSTSSGTSAQSASATGTDPAPCYNPFLFLARSQPGCSAPSPGPQTLLGHGSACTQVSPSKLCSLFSARSHTEKCVILYGVREISAYWRDERKQIRCGNPPTPWQAGAAPQWLPWRYLHVSSRLNTERMLRCVSIPHIPVFFLCAGSPKGEPKKLQHLKQKDFWPKQWLGLSSALDRGVKNKIKSFQFYVQLVPAFKGFIFFIAWEKTHATKTNFHISK